MSDLTTVPHPSLTDPEVIARRVQPAETVFAVQPDQQALVVADGRAARVLPPGRGRLRRFWQPRPEVYLIRSDTFLLSLWITDLTTVEGQALNLSWRVQVVVKDTAQLWKSWLQHVEAAAIPVPAGQVSARLVDPVQQVVGVYGIDDLRGDPALRRSVAGQISLLLRDHLAPFGLEIAAQFDPEHMHFQTETEVAQADAEREAVKRMREDAKTQTALGRIDNVEALTYRLREWAQQQDVELDGAQSSAAAALMLANPNMTPDQALAHVLQPLEVPDMDTPEVAELPPAVHTGPWHVFRHLSQFVLVATFLSVIVLAAIAYFEPGMMDGVDNRNRTIAMVTGIALLGVVVAWVLDQAMRWEAHRAAQRTLAAANLNHVDVDLARVELRHLLILFGALLAIGAAAVVLWLPEYYRWFRLGGATIGFFAAVYAIRTDWLRNVEVSEQVVQHAHRRVAGQALSRAERERQHAGLIASLAVEVEIACQRLDEAASLIFRNLRDRKLYLRVQGVAKALHSQLEAIAALETPANERTAGEWEEVEARIGELRGDVERCSASAKQIAGMAQRSEAGALPAAVTELEAAATDLDEALKRWKLVAA